MCVCVCVCVCVSVCVLFEVPEVGGFGLCFCVFEGMFLMGI